jgi:hypothetical protein
VEIVDLEQCHASSSEVAPGPACGLRLRLYGPTGACTGQ